MSHRENKAKLVPPTVRCVCVEFHVYVCVLVFLREEDREKPQESFVRELEVEEEAALRGDGANINHACTHSRRRLGWPWFVLLFPINQSS